MLVATGAEATTVGVRTEPLGDWEGGGGGGGDREELTKHKLFITTQETNGTHASRLSSQ